MNLTCASVQEFSGKTKEIFKEIMSRNQENIIEGRENAKINALIYSMRYRNNSGFSITDIRARIMTMTAVSEKFTRDMDEATRSYKTESSKDDSPKMKIVQRKMIAQKQKEVE